MLERTMTNRDAERSGLFELLPDRLASKYSQTQPVSLALSVGNGFGSNLSTRWNKGESICIVVLFILEVVKIKAFAKVFYLLDRAEIHLYNNEELDLKFELQDYKFYSETIWENEALRVLDSFLLLLNKYNK